MHFHCFELRWEAVRASRPALWIPGFEIWGFILTLIQKLVTRKLSSCGHLKTFLPFMCPGTRANVIEKKVQDKPKRRHRWGKQNYKLRALWCSLDSLTCTFNPLNLWITTSLTFSVPGPLDLLYQRPCPISHFSSIQPPIGTLQWGGEGWGSTAKIFCNVIQ